RCDSKKSKALQKSHRNVEASARGRGAGQRVPLALGAVCFRHAWARAIIESFESLSPSSLRWQRLKLRRRARRSTAASVASPPRSSVPPSRSRWTKVPPQSSGGPRSGADRGLSEGTRGAPAHDPARQAAPPCGRSLAERAVVPPATGLACVQATARSTASATASRIACTRFPLHAELENNATSRDSCVLSL